MMGCPQRLQGSVESGGKSPGMKTFASQPGQVTIFKLPLLLIALLLRFARADRDICAAIYALPLQQTSHVLPLLSRAVKAEAAFFNIVLTLNRTESGHSAIAL